MTALLADVTAPPNSQPPTLIPSACAADQDGYKLDDDFIDDDEKEQHMSPRRTRYGGFFVNEGSIDIQASEPITAPELIPHPHHMGNHQ